MPMPMPMPNEKTSNGHAPVIIDVALPENRQKIIEYGIAATQETANERDAALQQVEKLTMQNAALRVEIEALQAMSAAQESRAEAHQNSRDEAVAKRAEYEVILRSIQAQLREFGVQHEPLIGNGLARDRQD
jgi:hypothetical protein